MPYFSKKDFAALCGMETKQLSVYVQRGKIIVKNDLIDDANEKNLYFLKKRREKIDAEYLKESGGTGEIKIETTPTVKKTITSVKQSTEVSESDGLLNLESKKKRLDIEKVTEEIELLRIKKEKLHALVIPTDLAKSLFSQHSKSMLVEFQNTVDKVLTRISKRKALTNDEVAELRAEMIEEINKAVDKSIEETKHALKNLLAEYSEKKGRGERT